MNPSSTSPLNTAPVDKNLPPERVRARADHGTGGDGPTAQVDKLIAASAPDIWTALTTPAALKQFFFGADVVTDWTVGRQHRAEYEKNWASVLDGLATVSVHRAST